MIWAFGDSFTWGYGCKPGWSFTDTDVTERFEKLGKTFHHYPKYYVEHKKENDKIWVEWLGEWFNEEVKNVSKSGASNDKIFDWVIENFEKIKEKDKVIIGMTTWSRNDVPINNSWVSIVSGFEQEGLDVYADNISKENVWETIVNYQYFFSQSTLWRDRWKSRFDFIVNQLLKKKCQVFLFQIQESPATNIQTIRQETGIPDDHFSFTGHKKFAEIIYKKFTTSLI